MRKKFTTVFLLFISILTYAQPINDICSTAILLPVDGSCQIFDNIDATPSNNPDPLMHCDYNWSNAQDVWFKVTAPPSGNFTIEVSSITGGPTDMIMELYGGSCGSLNLIECSYHKLDFNDYEMPIIEREGMISGTEYYIRISAENEFNFGQFTICVTDQGYNQFPCKIEFLETSVQSACDPATNTYTQEITIHYRDILGTANSIYVLNEEIPITPSPMTVSIPNVPANSGFQSLFPQFNPFNKEGDLYIYNGFQRNSNCYSGTVSNDECTGAINLTADNMCVTYTGNNVGATYSGTGGVCEPFLQGTQDVWFQHTTTSTDDIIINAWDGSDVSPSIMVYKGSCGILNFEDCAFNYQSVRITGLTIGETVYIQVKDVNDDDQGDFNLCLIYPVPSTNDICVDAIAIPINTNCDPTQVYSNHYAIDESNGVQPPVCANYATGLDLWYQFVVPADGSIAISVEAVNINDQNSNNIGEVYSGSCGSLQLIDCKFLNNQSNFEIVNRTPGEILYLRVIQESFEPYVICTPELSNNYCAGAEDIPVGTCLITDNFNSTPSDNPYPGVLCGNGRNGSDVWFSTIVPVSGNVTIEINEIQGGLFSTKVELYDGGGCNTLMPIACSDRKDQNNSNHAKIELENRTPGEIIYIRVMGSNVNDQGSFEICISDAGYSDSCKIELIELVGQTNCDPTSNTYIQDLLITYRHDGSATHIDIFNEIYPLTSSPQIISVELPASGASFDINAQLFDTVNFTDCNIESFYYWREAVQTPAPCYNGTLINDECINAIVLPVSKGCIQNIFDNTGATFSQEINYICNGGFNPQDIWFSATVPASGELIINSWFTGQMQAAFDIFEGDCNNLNRIDECGYDDRSIRLLGRQPGEIIYIVASSSNIFQQGQFGLCAIEPETHTNDICADAITVPVISECAPEVFSTHFANAENGAIDCNGSGDNSNDIWFNIVVPNSGSLTLRTEEVERGSSYMIMEVYSGGCQSPFTACALSNSSDGHVALALNGLTPGDQLQIRIASFWSYDAATFTFCAISDCPDNDLIAGSIPDIRDYEAHISVSGTSVIESTATVDFDAGQEINLLPGFEVESGALFHAFIDGCGGI